MKHYYEVIIDHETYESFYTNKQYEVGDVRKGKGFTRDCKEVFVSGTITAIVLHEGF